MTAIVGLVDNGEVWMGGDSAGVAGYSLSVRADPKVFVHGEFLFGHTSSFRMAQILRYHLTIPRPIESQEPFEFMVAQFMPAVRQAMKDHGYLETDSGRESIGTFLVGWRGRLYSVESDLQVGENAAAYAACGCGQDLALGSLHTTEHLGGLTPKDRVRLALEAAEALSTNVRGPFTIMSA